MERLRSKLSSLDGKGYKSYKALAGSYDFPDYRLDIDHVQGDPFAQPSRISIHMDMSRATLPESLYSSPIRQLALEDFLARLIRKSIKRHVKGRQRRVAPI